MNHYVLEAQDIVKKWNGQVILDKVNIQLKSGTIYGLVGPNGSGKSTLAHILGGVRSMDQGQIKINQKTQRFLQPRDALKKGISLFHQDLSLVPRLSVMDNILLANIHRQGLQNRTDRIRYCNELLERIGADHIQCNQTVEDLSMEDQYKVEIARALSVDPHFLIMDEPFAHLGKDQAKQNSLLIKQLAQLGLAILLISHQFRYVLPLCDAIYILKDKTMELWDQKPPFLKDQLVKEIYGKVSPFPIQNVRDYKKPKEIPLLYYKTKWNKNRTMEIKAFEGFIQGYYYKSSQIVKKLFRSLYGLSSSEGVQCRFKDRPFYAQSPQEAIAKGIMIIPDKSMGSAMISHHNLLDNILLPILPKLTLGYFLDMGNGRKKARLSAKSVALKEDVERTHYHRLSGGNKQKVALARALAAHGRCLILHEPLAGLDRESSQTLIQQLNSLCKNGKSMIIISRDRDQLASFCHGVSPMFSKEEIRL